ncbi:MAG TPA: glycoside hydrolase family 31 protein, partial [Candidatus Sumerlaeota bacterium]|nr:glycoside hydrolase family 31 protein [Candidatus Sumerlaeota bacterium]
MSRNRYEWHIRNDEGGITLRKGSRSFPMHVEDWGEGVLRILAGTEVPSGSPPFLQGRGKPVIPEISHEILAFSTEASSFIMDRNGVWHWTHKGRIILQGADDCYVSPRGVRSLAPALRLENRSATFSFHLTPDEPVFGGGETFGQINKRRLKMELRITDTCGLTTTPMSYKHIPLFWSPRGWGVFAGTGHHVTADIGCSSFISMSLEIREPRLDIFLIPGAPCDIIKHYWRLTGVPPLPPAWGLAPWWSRCMYRNAGEVKAVVGGLAGMGIREGVISPDPLWLRNRLSWKHDACDFVWNESAFGDMQAFCDWLHGEGFKLCLWENPRVWLDGEDPAGLRSFVMKDSGGNILQAEAPLSRGGRTRRMEHTGVWDFASPEAWEKRKMLIRQLLMRGADTFKTDYGEGAPGEDHHNMYAFQYLKNTWEAIEEIRGPAETMIWARPGW